MNHPKRFDLWLPSKLVQMSESDGTYKLTSSKPDVFFYHFTKTKAASDAKESDFPLTVLAAVPMDDILPPVKKAHVEEIYLKSDLVTVGRDEITEIIEALEILKAKGEGLDPNSYSKTVSTLKFHAQILRVDELSVNRSLVAQIQESGKFNDFAVGTESPFPYITNVYGTSKADLVMYHKKNLVRCGEVTGLVARITIPQDEEEEEGIHEVRIGIGGEMKLKAKKKCMWQLVASMEKVAGDLGIMAAHRRQLFDNIRLYGLLIDCNASAAIALRLDMCFIEQYSSLKYSETGLGINECFKRLSTLMRK